MQTEPLVTPMIAAESFAQNLLYLAEQLDTPATPVQQAEAAPLRETTEESDLAREAATSAGTTEVAETDSYEPPMLEEGPCQRTFPVLNPRCRREYLEQFRALRTRLCLEQRNWALRQLPLQVVSVLSPAAGDGRSFVAANLAASLAVSEAQVLLVDANTAAPSLHGTLGVSASPGLTEALQGPKRAANQAWWTMLHRVPATNLFTLTLGAGGATAIDTVDLQKLPALIEHWRHCFDWVILDGPAFQVTSDAEILSEIADASLLVIRPGHTLFAAAQQATARMPSGRVLGVVMNPRPA